MTGIEFTLVLLAWAIGGASPGPATLAIAGTSMGHGRRAGLAVAAGIVVGSGSWGIAAALGMSALMLAHAWLLEIIRYVGAAFLLWLAIRALRSAARPGSAAFASSVGQAPFLKGLAIHLTNPKAILGWGAVFAVIVPPGADVRTLVATFLAFFAVSNIVFFGYALLFSTPGAVILYRRARRWFEAAFGLLFGFAALRILTARLA
ncbi:MAG: LysE family translocator [Pseudomonadota bacterium]